MTKLLGAEHIEKLQKEIAKSSNQLSASIEKLFKSVDAVKASNDNYAKSQEKYQFWLCALTFGLIIATLAQAFVVYWTSK